MAASTNPADGRSLPKTIGEYEIVGVLGVGGMGVVYEALQSAPHRRVALKLLRLGLLDENRSRRFEQEAEVLGWLNHPGIAQIYESGVMETEDGPQPFLAMELVDGERIDQWVESRNCAEAARLDLVAKVCDAVQHAHQKGVIHRDLKPGNILVDQSGQPKILDFGVARATNRDLEASQQTSAGEILGTLAYMSPEQIAADPSNLDTRSDVYALGVLTYELLSGQRPYELEAIALHEAARVISEDEPTTLGSLNRRWKGDVEVLVAKAMAKEKERRYGSADEFAGDIRRHLNSEPIEAKPAGSLYRFRKFARRNKAVVGGIAAVFLALVGGIAVSTSLFLRFGKEARANEALSEEFAGKADENEALSEQFQRESDTANQTVAFLEEIFSGTDPLAEDELTAKDLVDRSAERIVSDDALDPHVRFRLLSLLGGAYNSMGIYVSSKPLLRRALELHDSFEEVEGAEFADALERLAQSERWTGGSEDGERLQRRTLEIRTRVFGEVHPEVASAWNNLGNFLADQNEREEAGSCFRKAIEVTKASEGEEAEVPFMFEANLATHFWHAGHYEEAEEMFYRLLERPSLKPGARAYVLLEFGGQLKTQRRFEEAEAYLLDAERIGAEVFGPRSTTYWSTRLTLANLYVDMNRLDEAGILIRGYKQFTDETYGEDAPISIVAAHDLAYFLHETPDLEEAEKWYLVAITRWERIDSGHPSILMAKHNLGALYTKWGRLELAEQFAREAFDGRLELLGADHPSTMISKSSLGTILNKLGDFKAAEKSRREHLQLSIQHDGPAAILTQRARLMLGRFLVERGETAEAEEVFLEAWERIPEMPEPGSVPTELAEELLDLYEVQGEEAQVEVWRDRLVEAKGKG